MRVIAGTAKGTRLYGAKDRRVRPVLDRIKESLFAALGDGVEGTRVLDLFAGVGNLGIEALSRGASHADFFEQHRATADAIKANLERAHLSETGSVRALKLPRGLSAARGPYGLIFVDPPFRIDKRLLEGLFGLISERGLLEESGVLVYRHSTHDRYEPPKEAWSLEERRDYGDSIVSIYSSSIRSRRHQEVNRLKIALCPGTFDPVTNGHLDVILRTARHFEKLIVAVAVNPEKSPMFGIEDRLGMLRECLAGKGNIEVITFDCLLIDVAQQHNCCCIVKGLRAMSDFEFEFQMAQFNRQMDESIETFFVMASPEYTYLSSSGIKEVVSYGGNIKGLVPKAVERRLEEKFGKGKAAGASGKE